MCVVWEREGEGDAVSLFSLSDSLMQHRERTRTSGIDRRVVELVHDMICDKHAVFLAHHYHRVPPPVGPRSHVGRVQKLTVLASTQESIRGHLHLVLGTLLGPVQVTNLGYGGGKGGERRKGRGRGGKKRDSHCQSVYATFSVSKAVAGEILQ